MNVFDIFMVIVFGIPILIWAYHRVMYYIGSPPYVKFDSYLRKKNMLWLTMVEEMVIWSFSIAFICAVFYFILNL